MPESAEERSAHARRANLFRQMKEPSGAAMTAAARAAFLDSFYSNTDPSLPPEERQRQADAAWQVWSHDFSQIGVRARRAKAAARKAQEDAAAAARSATAAGEHADAVASAAEHLAPDDIAV